MKYPFKPSKVNIVYASIAVAISVLLNILLFGFNSYTLGMCLGIALGIILIPTILAVIFWFILGRKEKGGTTTFNIVLTLMFLSSISQSGKNLKDREKPIDDLQQAISEYKENAIMNPDSMDSNYSEFSSNVRNSIDDLIESSVGEERKVWLVLKGLFKKSDSTNISWNEAYNAFIEPRILDFNRLDNPVEFEFQKKIIQEYISQSINYRSFVEKRTDYLNDKTKNIDQNNSAYIGFMKGFTKKDSIQKLVLFPYINAHIKYGQEIKKIVELLEEEHEGWSYDEEVETLVFENPEAQSTYEKYLEDAISNEEIVNELSDKIIEIM